MFAARWRICSQCHKPMHGRLPPLTDVYCVTCKLDRAKDAAFSMANKTGPYYDAWLRTRGPQGRPRNHD